MPGRSQKCNDVWGAARLRDPADRDRLAGAGVRPTVLDLSTDEFAMLPDDFTYVFHAAVDTGTADWAGCVETNAQRSGDLLAHCRSAKGFVLCSTGSIYGYQGRRPLTEDDPPGVPLRANYSFSKVAAESVCSWVSRHYGIPLSIIRICSTYGPEGGAPADRLEAILARRPIRLHPMRPTTTTRSTRTTTSSSASGPWRSANTPPVVVNWAGSETVSIEDYCTYLGELVGIDPIFEYTEGAHTPLWPDVTRMHHVLEEQKCRGEKAFGAWWSPGTPSWS